MISIWKAIDEQNLLVNEKISSWEKIKWFLETGSNFLVNDIPLSEILTIQKPEKIENFSRIDFPSGGLILGELFSFGEAREGSYFLKLKGTKNCLYISESRYKNLIVQEQEILRCVKEVGIREISDVRIIVLAAVINTGTGGSIKISSLALRAVDRKTFKKVSVLVN